MDSEGTAAEPFDGREDIFGSLGPAEGFGVGIAGVDIGGDGRFAVVLGGDCSIVLGCLLGARQSARGSVGLAYFDAHADFGTPEESRTGSAASMCLAFAVGRGETPLARLAGNESYAINLIESLAVGTGGVKITSEGETWVNASWAAPHFGQAYHPGLGAKWPRRVWWRRLAGGPQFPPAG